MFLLCLLFFIFPSTKVSSSDKLWKVRFGPFFPTFLGTVTKPSGRHAQQGDHGRRGGACKRVARGTRDSAGGAQRHKLLLQR